MMNTIRICLLNPIAVSTYPPLSLTYLSAYLKKYGKHKYEFKLVDINCSKDIYGDILSFNPHILGITSLSPHIVKIIEIAQKVRALNKDIAQVAGGAHAMVEPADFLLRGGCDVVVMGEGEAAFTELVDGYAENGGKFSEDFLSAVSGIAYKRENGVKVNPERALISDLDAIPHPDRDLLDNDFYMKRYYVFRGMDTHGITTIAASRGCPFRCIFCCVNFLARSRVRFHSAEYVVDEMEQLRDKYDARWLFFTDDTFLVNKEKTRELCELMIEKGLNRRLKWEVQVRSNLVAWADLPLMKLMKKAGCAQMDYGFESGNQRVLTLIKGKGITVENHETALDVTRAAGIAVMGTFIVGTPTETFEEMLDTKRFILRNYKKMQNFQVSCMIPYPGTPVFEICVEKGLIAKDYYEEASKERATREEHGLQVFSDIVPAARVLELRRELDVLSFKKVGAWSKAKWFGYNLFNRPRTVIDGVWWTITRSMRGT